MIAYCVIIAFSAIFGRMGKQTRLVFAVFLWYTGQVTEGYKRNPNINCIICAKPIYKRPQQIQLNNGRVFCGQNCFGESCRKEVPCVVCGKLILSGLHKKTCSRGCANTHRAGITYSGRALQDKVKSQRALKNRLLESRGTSCERCGYDKFEILQIHHKNRNRENNDLGNLELICPNCHYEEHYLEKSWLKNISKNK